ARVLGALVVLAQRGSVAHQTANVPDRSAVRPPRLGRTCRGQGRVAGCPGMPPPGRSVTKPARVVHSGGTPVGMPRTVVFSDHTLGMGGGERYLLALLDALLARGRVELLVGSDAMRPDPARFRAAFGWEVERPGLTVGVLDDPEALRGADLFVNLSHFRVLPPLARRNLVAVFFPQLLSEWIGRYDAVVTISEFSAHWIRRYWNVDHLVILPPAVEPIAAREKTPTILSVGRFFDVRDGNV